MRLALAAQVELVGLVGLAIATRVRLAKHEKHVGGGASCSRRQSAGEKTNPVANPWLKALFIF